MSVTHPELSEEQWAFLAVLEALPGPVSMDLAGRIVPLRPGPLFDLLGKVEGQGWVQKMGQDHLMLIEDIPDSVRSRLSLINRNRLCAMVDQIYAAGFEHKVEPQAMICLLEKAGRGIEASQQEFELARRALRSKDRENAWKYLKKVVERFIVGDMAKEAGALFIDSTLQLSSLSYNLGRVFEKAELYLTKAYEAARGLGDQRSLALINLHLGRACYITDRRDQALAALTAGLEMVQELGDDDILSQAAGYLGLYYFMQGLFPEAMEHLKRAQLIFESTHNEMHWDPSVPISLAFCGIYLGQFHWVLGHLDFNLRTAKERSDHFLAATLRAILGTVLLLLNKRREALSHLNLALTEAERHQNPFGLLAAKRGIALSRYLDGRMDQAYEILKQSSYESQPASLASQYSSPWFLEMLFEFDRLGFEPIPDLSCDVTLSRIWKETNIHLQGVALRLHVRRKAALHGDRDTIYSDLKKSEELLSRSGDPVQLARTRLEMARLALQSGEKEKAGKLAQKAWHDLGGYTDEFFPDEFRHLVEHKGVAAETEDRRQVFIHQYLEMIKELFPEGNQSEVLLKMVNTTSRLFGAERGALFWFSDGRHTDSPELRAANNLTKSDVNTAEFLPSRELISRAFRSKEPLVVRSDKVMEPDGVSPVRAAMCIPIEVQGKVRGILYFDNSYLNDAFDSLDKSTLGHFTHHTNTIVERIFDYLNLKEKWQLLDSECSQRLLEIDNNQFIAQSSSMLRVLNQVERVATTESTVLITGETGTGKEVLAARLHHKSSRSDGPFIVIDATTIPEHLLESELFGHEKGAFTGADRRKIGRIELAHQGTLFIDEIGELPHSAQAKLLRVLQEKEFHRVGGTRIITSNFRLIAATNRELEKEVAEGRFREDLYYRLNVIPIHLPPLRERQADIPLLAAYFIGQYAKKYNRQNLKLTGEQESMLCNYKWPGNVRELQNIIERSVLLSTENWLDLALPVALQKHSPDPFEDLPTLGDVQRRYIEFVMKKTDGQIGGPGGAAEILGMNRTSLYSRMRQLKLNVKSLRQ